MTADTDTEMEYLTTREACRRLGYSRPDSFLRAWRARGLPLYRRGAAFGQYLVAVSDLERFVEPALYSLHQGH